jgi:hypothetical protein
MQEQHAGRSRRLAMPAPAFIPLEAPQELLQQSEQQREGVRPGDAGSWRQQQQHVYAAAGNRLAGIAPTELVEQVRPLKRAVCARLQCVDTHGTVSSCRMCFVNSAVLDLLM